MEWKGGLYLDAALPFGLRSAPVIFNAVVEALAFIIRRRGVDGMDHYLAPVVSSTVEWMARLRRRVNCSQGVTTNYRSNSNLGPILERGYSTLPL